MQIAKIKDNQVESMGEHKMLFPNVSFPSSGPTSDWMSENSVMPVTVGLSYDPLTQKMSQVSPYIDSGVVYTVKVESLTDSEKEVAKNDSNNALATSNRAQRDKLLAETDWMVTKALESGGTLADNWKTYRQALRDITTHSNWPALKVPNMDGSGDNDWPVKPS